MKNLIVFIFSVLFIGSTSAQKCNMPWVDLSSHVEKQIVIAEGTEAIYNGHPTTVLMDDGKTILCTWSLGHGGKAAFIAKSNDGGLTWHTDRAPEYWNVMRNCPSIYRLSDKQGKERLYVFCQEPLMGYSYSEDNGQTWSEIQSLKKPCVMAFSSIVKLSNNDYLGVYHRGWNDQDRAPLTLWSAISHDGGLNWTPSVKIAEVEGRSPCEPCVFYSPDKKQLVCIARENNRVGNSLMMFSNDEGKTWSAMRETPWGVTGDRHVARYLKDGRLLIAFRDMAPDSPTKGHFVAWVGTYKDLIEGTSGQYRIKLLHSYAGSDCGYPGLEVLPDGTIVAITYVKYKPGKKLHSIVEVRFKLDETDNMLK